MWVPVSNVPFSLRNFNSGTPCPTARSLSVQEVHVVELEVDDVLDLSLCRADSSRWLMDAGLSSRECPEPRT
jgi:hypothetical protein